MDWAGATTGWPGPGGRWPADKFQDISHGDKLAHGPVIDAWHESLPSRATARNREEEPVGLQRRGRNDPARVNARIVQL
jgi:hypothetical protein